MNVLENAKLVWLRLVGLSVWDSPLWGRVGRFLEVAGSFGGLIVAIAALLIARDTRDIRQVIAHLSSLADQTKRQADGAQRQLVDAGRAWVTPQSTNFQKSASGDYILTTSYANPGRGPALDVDMYIYLQTANPAVMDDGRLEAWIGSHDPCANGKPASNRAVAYPGIPDKIQVNMSRIKGLKPTLDTFDKGGSVMIITLCFSYRTFGEKHQTATCYYDWPGRTNGINLPLCDRGQYAN